MLLVVTHKPNIHRIPLLQQTYLNKLHVPHIAVYGDDMRNTCFFDERTRVLIVPCPDSYEFLTVKLAHAYRWILSQPGLADRGILKVDDDVFLRPTAFNEYWQQTKHDYEGVIHSMKGAVFSRHHFRKTRNKWLDNIVFCLDAIDYCTGPAYYLSKRALQGIVESFDQTEYNVYSYQLFEDYTFGKLLAELHIRPAGRPLFTENVTEFVHDNACIGFHDKLHHYDFSNLAQQCT